MRMQCMVAVVLLVTIAAATSLAGVAGIWSGAARHDGTTGDVVVRLGEVDDTTFTAALSLPAIDVWDLPVGRAVLDGDTLRLGWWSIHHDRARGVLDGALPAALVPVYRIPFTLTRADSLRRPAPEPAAVTVAVEPYWSVNTGAPVWAGVAAAAGTVYVGNDAGLVLAVRSVDGGEVWRFRCGGPIRARPTVHDGAVLVHSDDGFLYRLDAASGEQRWRVRVLESPYERVAPGQPGARYDHYASSAAVSGSRLFVGTGDGAVQALDLRTGALLWEFHAGDAVAATPAVSDGTVIVGSFDGGVYALDARTGGQRWRRDTGAPVVSAAALWEGHVIVGSRSYDLLALDVDDGVPAWSHYMWFSWVESPASVRDGTAYVGSSDAQRLFAFDAADGTPRWSFDTGGSVWAQPAVGESAVFVGAVGVSDYMVDHHGGFFAVDRESGEVVWRFPAGRPGQAHLWGFAASPALDGGRVFAGGLDGRLYAFPEGARGAAGR